MAGENLDNNFAPEGLDGAMDPGTDTGDMGATGQDDIGGSDAADSEDYSFERWQREKGYKSPDDLGKAYGHANKALKEREAENARFRQYISESIPWIRYAEAKYKEEQEAKGQTGQKPPEAPRSETATKTANGQSSSEDMRKMIADITKEMIGPQISKLEQQVTLSNVKTILKSMREDKKTFPYMNKDIENEMNNVLKMTNKAFPVSEEGIKELYNAAVGRTLPKILSEERNKITDEISSNFERRDGSFIESDKIGEAGSLKDAHKNIVDSIRNASYGKSQI